MKVPSALLGLTVLGCAGRPPMDVTRGDPPEVTTVGWNERLAFVVDQYEPGRGRRARLTLLVHPRNSKLRDVRTRMHCLDGRERSPDTAIAHDSLAGEVTLEFEEDDCSPAVLSLVLEPFEGSSIELTISRALLYRARRWPEVVP